MSRISFLFLFLVFSFSALAQKKIKFIHADEMRGNAKSGKRFERLIGHVAFEQNTTRIDCDSAHLYKKDNRLEAFGHVHITDDSVDITSLYLDYDGNEKMARLRKQVVFEKTNKAKLYTDYLDYYRTKSLAKYFNGGKLVDSANTLTSDKGYYNTRTNLASFKKNVVGVGKDFTLYTDTLQYNTQSKIVFFHTLTRMIDKEGKTAFYERGTYNTLLKTSTLHTGEMETQDYKIDADHFDINDVKKYYEAKGHVKMTSKTENLTVYGDDGYFDKKKGISKVWNNAYVAKPDNKGDTLFLTADTLVSIESNDVRKKRLLAYHNVKIYKKDMQGKADSLAYVAADSVLHFYHEPILWNEGNQMTADSMRMLLKNKKIDKIYMVNNSFVVSQDSLGNFNQIKGRRMTTYFNDSTIDHVIVDGNGESIYYALEEKEMKNDTLLVKITVLMGMNKIICSNIRIFFKAGKVSVLKFLMKPDASFYPPHEITEENTKLKGFSWQIALRPKREEVVKKPGEERKVN